MNRVEADAKAALALVNRGGVGCDELRRALRVSEAARGILSALQTNAASTIAKSERHGDGGTGILAEAAGLTRRDARGQVKTAEAISAAPTIRDAVEQGRVSQSNARRLAEAVKKTSAEAVEADAGLLAKAAALGPDQFAREARRWAADRQDDGGEREYRRLRARRCVHVWDGEDGTVQLHGVFDPVTGRRIGNRLKAEARRMYHADKKHAASGAGERSNPVGGRGRPRDVRGNRPDNTGNQRPGGRGAGTDANGRGGTLATERRTFEQCMADALDNLTSHTTTGTGPGVGRLGNPATSTGPDRRAGVATNRSPRTGQDSGTGTGSPTNTNPGTSPATDTSRGSPACGSCATANTNPGTSPTATDTASASGTDIGRPASATTNTGERTDAGQHADSDARTDRPAETLTDTGAGERTCVGACASAGTATTSTSQGVGTCIGTGANVDAGTSWIEDMATGADSGAGQHAGPSAGKSFADISVIAHVDNDTGKLIAELPDGERLPSAALEQLACNARLTGLVYDTTGTPIWRAKSSRTATEGQRQALLNRWGGCFHCAADPDMCQIHHIVPVSQGGATKIDNMVPVCWDCHNKIHHHRWQIRKRPGGQHSLHPPDSTHHGPAHALRTAPAVRTGHGGRP